MSGTTNVSQVVAEVLSQDTSTPVRVTQVETEALVAVSGIVRVTQAVVEVIIQTLGFVRVSQIEAEALSSGSPVVRASQLLIEELIDPYGIVRVTQCFIEMLVVNLVLSMPLIYPTLPGLTYSVTKRIITNFGVGEASGGGEVRVSFWENPLYEWDLTYEYLPDFTGTGGATPSDFKALFGFFAATMGFLPFCFLDPDDNQIIGQPAGVGTGTQTNFQLARTYGLPAYGTTTDNVGYVNLSGPNLNGHGPFNVYVGGVLKTFGTDYTLVQTTPMGQYIVFTTPPASGATVLVDMSFYYWVRFLDPKYDFEKFMNQLWSIKKITLHQLRY